MTILRGDCVEHMRMLPADSVDACVTDPPYELGFMGQHWDKAGIAFQPDLWREVWRVVKPGAHVLACGGTRTYHRMALAIEDAGFEIRDCLAWLYGSGFPKSLNLGDGLGTALKPAYEPIVLARKPFTGTVKGNVERYGTGALNIDACRIEGDVPSCTQGQSRNAGTIYGADQRNQREFIGDERGRWPANVALDELAAMVLDEQSGELASGFMPAGTQRDGIGYHGGLGNTVRNDTHGDVGGASRFYYVAKPSREERDFGIYDLEPKTAAELTNRKPGSAGLQNPRAGIRAGSANRDVNARVARNFHPTVKPVELMRWLVRLVTPINGTVIDPFMGSGTTGMACRYELRDFIGIEREAEYIAIAERRIAAVAPIFAEHSA